MKPAPPVVERALPRPLAVAPIGGVQDFHLDIYAVAGPRVWPRFMKHHYMREDFNGHRSFLAVLPSGDEVAFLSIIRFPHPYIKNGWRGHREVVLPDFQGMGIGGCFADWAGEYCKERMRDAEGNPGRFFARFVHPRLGMHQEASPRWKPTALNGRKVQLRGSTTTWSTKTEPIVRVAYAHEYIGGDGEWQA